MKYSKNAAPFDAPPYLSFPEFFKSANLLFISSLCSLKIGKLHTGSKTSLRNFFKYRIENMRKMQNEEHQKLIVAHQNQMQQLKLQQVF